MTELDDNYFEQGLRLLEAGDFDGAVAMFDSAIKLGLGDLAEIYLCRGEALASLQRWDEALKSINAALEIEPYMAAAYYERGLIRGQQGEPDLAINDYTMAIHIEPEFEEAYFSRALAYEARKRYAEAEADLTRTLRLNKHELGAYEARGRVRAAQFKYDEAIADLSAYLRSGGGKQFDNHSETQGYLLVLRAQRLLLRLVPRWRRG
ncbi:MAG: tetratricopeptide repeat protein [Chloroflexota bacterium]|nr:tetratricopeptide repeat protein [Chloroflexota bacterium]